MCSFISAQLSVNLLALPMLLLLASRTPSSCLMSNSGLMLPSSSSSSSASSLSFSKVSNHLPQLHLYFRPNIIHNLWLSSSSLSSLTSNNESSIKSMRKVFQNGQSHNTTTKCRTECINAHSPVRHSVVNKSTYYHLTYQPNSFLLKPKLSTVAQIKNGRMKRSRITGDRTANLEKDYGTTNILFYPHACSVSCVFWLNHYEISECFTIYLSIYLICLVCVAFSVRYSLHYILISQNDAFAFTYPYLAIYR